MDRSVFRYSARSGTQIRVSVALCPGRLEKAQVVEALQESAFFIMDAPAPSPEARNFRQHVFEGDQGE